MSSQVDRKAELERKKAKLAQIREEKKRLEDERRNALLDPSKASSDVSSASAISSLTDVEKLLADVGISPYSPATPSDEQPPGELSVPDDAVSKTVEASPSHTVFRSRGKVQLDKSVLVQINVPPKEAVLYSKTTQTLGEPASVDKELVPGHSWEWDDEFNRGDVGQSLGSPSEEVFDLDASPTHQIAGLLPHIEMVKPAEVAVDKKEEEKREIRQLSEEEKQKAMSTEEFRKFFDRASRVIERALTEKEDIFVDYSRGMEQEKVDTGVKLILNRVFFDEKWTKGRCVTAMDCSLQHPELLAVSYNNNEDTPQEPDGVVLVWNTKFKKTTPEYIFYCQSRVLSLTWAKFHPNLLLGGTYSGQICLWDNRQNKRTPVQKSPLSSSAHTHPVYCLKVVGTQNAHNLVSVSTDGKLCSWSLDMLSQPLEVLDLQLKQSKQVAATCLSFPQSDVNNFIVGGEDGAVYSGCRHGQKAGIVDMYDGHAGPITAVDCHAAVGPVDFSHLFLTSSFDWTVKLWNSKESKPLCSFEDHSDYVFDAAWSPIHPALFACVDGRGQLDLWQLNQDIEMPAATLTVGEGAALNKVIWLPSGHQLAVGDDSGKLWIYDVNEQLATPKANEWSQFAKSLNEVKQSQVEAEELVQAMALSSSPMR